MREAIAGFYGSNFRNDLLILLLCYVPISLLIGLGLRPALSGLNHLFDKKLAETEFMMCEPHEISVNRSTQLALLLKASLSQEELKLTTAAKAQAFEKNYRRMVRYGFLAIALIPLIFLILMFSLESKIIFLVLWIISIIAIALFLIIVEFIHSKLEEQQQLAGMTFDVGIFTNFSDDHIGGVEHKDLAEYLYCKSLLFRQCKFAAANIDDPAWKDITKDFKGSVLTYGFADNADLKGKNAHLLSENGFVGVHFETEGIKNLSVDVDIPGKFNAYNALAAISAVSFFDEIEDQMIIDALKVAKVKGRVERVPVPYNYTLIIDYAHNALSMENVLETLRQYNPHRLITMFGAGGNRPKVRRYEMGETSGRLSDLSVVTEDNSRFEDVMDIIEDIKTGLAKTDGKYVVVPNRRDAIKYCMDNAEDGDIIVLAGKGHEDYQEIKGVKYHMDEREIIADILNGKS